MNRGYVLKTFIVFCLAIVFVYGGFTVTHFYQNKRIKPQKEQRATIYKSINFIKPDYPPSKSKHLTRVEIDVRDDLTTPNGKVKKVSFEDDTLNLKPSAQYGKRGSTFLQLKPGDYTISWTVKNNRYKWPRETVYTKKIQVNQTDLWIHILIEGNKITIS